MVGYVRCVGGPYTPRNAGYTKLRAPSICAMGRPKRSSLVRLFRLHFFIFFVFLFVFLFLPLFSFKVCFLFSSFHVYL